MPLNPRRKTRTINLGGVLIGSEHPIVLQSMTNTPTRAVQQTLSQITALSHAGAQIARLAVLDQEDATALPEIIRQSPLPLVADIHFDARLALIALDAGIAGLRLNPGNIRQKREIKTIAHNASARKVPIRIGVNAGSLDKKRFPHPNAANMVQSALEHLAILEELDFHDIKVSLKSSDLSTMIEAYRLFAPLRDYPLHLGVTEAEIGRP